MSFVLQVTSNYFILVPSFLGALLTLTAIAVCIVFPRCSYSTACQPQHVDVTMSTPACQLHATGANNCHRYASYVPIKLACTSMGASMPALVCLCYV